jgi:T5orf172 domain
LRYSDDRIKIGMSSHIEQRLRQYKGYQKDAKDVVPIFVFKSLMYKKLERFLHSVAT